MISDYFTMAMRTLARRGVRSWLTMLGIFISIATIFTLVSLSIGLQEAVQEQFRLLGGDKFFIQPRGQLAGPGTGGAVSLSLDDVEAIEKVVGVQDVSYWTASSVEVEFKNQKRFLTSAGYPLDTGDLFLENGAYKIDEGRFLEEGDQREVMLGSQFKYRALFDVPVHANDKIKINGQEFRVRTILQPLGNPGDDRTILMSIEDIRALTNITSRVDMIVVQADHSSSVEEVASRVERKLRTFRNVDEKTQDFTILTPEELTATFGSVLSIITGFLLGIAAISLLVGGIGITNTMYTSVLERTREIGIMKAIGARNRDILTIFLIESGLLGLVGGIVGVILGIGISKGIEFIVITLFGVTLLQAALPLWLVVGCLLFSFCIGALSGLIPSWQASGLKTVDALRYE